MENYHIAGYAASVVNENQVVWHRNYGYAIMEENISVSDSTLFMIASISKTIVATAIMQLWEDGWFNLDDDINNYLPGCGEIYMP